MSRLSDGSKIHFLSTWRVRTGPGFSDGVTLQRGDVITVTPELRRWNCSDHWSWLDIADDPAAQQDAFAGNVIVGVGPWPANLEIDGPSAPRPYWIDPPEDDSRGRYVIKNSSHVYRELPR